MPAVVDTSNLEMHAIRDEAEQIAVRVYLGPNGAVWLAQGDMGLRLSPKLLRDALAIATSAK